jgi:hypothetical protein
MATAVTTTATTFAMATETKVTATTTVTTATHTNHLLSKEQKEVIFGIVEDLKRYKRGGVKAESEEVEETKIYHLHNII